MLVIHIISGQGKITEFEINLFDSTHVFRRKTRKYRRLRFLSQTSDRSRKYRKVTS